MKRLPLIAAYLIALSGPAWAASNFEDAVKKCFVDIPQHKNADRVASEMVTWCTYIIKENAPPESARIAMDPGIQVDVMPVRVIRRDTEEPDNEDHWKNDAPFPKLQYGQELCMSNIPPGDPFYAQCKKCEKKASECSGELRDRMRRSPYGDPQLMLIVATSANNENAAVIISKKPRKEAVKDALKECSDGGRFVCRDEVGSVNVYTYKSGLETNKNNCRYVSISEDAYQGVHWLSVGGTPGEATAGCIADKRGARHKCRKPVGACTGV